MSTQFKAMLLTTLLLATAPASAQELYMILKGREGVRLGSTVSPIGDLDGDGVDDIVVGGMGDTKRYQGLVLVASGADGSVIRGPHYGVTGTGNASTFGLAVNRVGDFDGDGFEDYAVGDRWEDTSDGSVFVFSGRTGKTLAELKDGDPNFVKEFGDVVAGLGDLDGDGYSEIVVSSKGTKNFWIFSGPDGALFRHHQGPLIFPKIHFAGLGDVNGDQYGDYAAGYPSVGVWVYSGRDGSVLYRVTGDHFLDHLATVAALGDVNGDGIPDFAAGAPRGNPNTPWGGCQNGGGYVRFYSGLDGEVLRHISHPVPESNQHMALRVVGGGDLNGDGYQDVLVTQPCGELVYAFSGRTGAMIFRIKTDVELPQSDLTNLAWPATILSDLDGDGYAEVALGDIYSTSEGPFSGRVYVLKGGPGDAVVLCEGSPNSAGPGARLRTRNSVAVSDHALELTITGGPPGGTGQFVYGDALANTPFGDGLLCVGGSLGLVPLNQPARLDATGSTVFKVEFNTPLLGDESPAWRPGTTWFVQYIYRDLGGPGGNGFNASNALELTVGK